MKSLTVRRVRHWNRLPGEGVDSPAVEVLQARFWITLSNLAWCKVFLSFQPRPLIL